jgi:hypothetical protein
MHALTTYMQLDPEVYDELHSLASSRAREQFEAAVQSGDTEELQVLYDQMQVM